MFFRQEDDELVNHLWSVACDKVSFEFGPCDAKNFSSNLLTQMNETSRGGTGRGCGDPPIGGYPPSITPTSSGSGGTPTSSAATTSTTSGSSEEPGLPSLGATLGSEFESFGDSLNLTRLLAGDTGSWDFSDPLSNANSAANQANQGSYRPWEADIAPATTSSLLTLSTMSRGPPNVLAPPSTTSSLLSRPHISTGHHAPSVQHQYAYYQPHPHHLASHHQAHQHLIDQRLPSFQSQFQDPTPHHHQVNPHYPLVPPAVQAREIPNLQQQFLDERHIQSSQLSAAWPHSHFAAAARLQQIGGGQNQGSHSSRGRKTNSQQQQQQQQQQHHHNQHQQQHHQQHQQQHHHQTDLTLLGDSQRPSSVSSLNSSSSLTQVTYHIVLEEGNYSNK